jgi:hypothetical protein
MVSNCANPQCAKPLHYLREGRIFVFDVNEQSNSTGEKKGHHLEHYWLCGACSQMFLVEHQNENGIQLVPRLTMRKYVVQEKAEKPSAPVVMAS